MQETIDRLLASNRTEELGYDVWKEYVLPPFFGHLAIGQTKKPRIIIGGRGCGKTMLLRYLSHESTFSRLRPNISTNALSHIGLYWRSDTQFASLMQHRGVAADVWETAFGHLAAVVLGIELLRSLDSIAKSSCGAITMGDIGTLDFGRLRAYRPDIPASATEVCDYLEDCLAEFESWANNVRATPPPMFLPQHFLKRLIALVRRQLPQLDSAVFFVYIDEYENLAEYQQRIVNTWLKHSEPPLIFNLAMKRNGFKTRSTDGSESLADIHDYRTLDLEDFDLEKEFPVFAAEILLLRLQLGGVKVPVIEADQLRDIASVDTRKQPVYTRQVETTMRTMFPAVSQRDMAAEVFVDSTLRRRFREKLHKALERRGIPEKNSQFVREDYPEASIVVPALLYRDSLTTDLIAEELAKVGTADNRFTGTTNWVHNNFVGCYLQLFDGLGRPCPFFSGFETFCFVSRGNLRHFLELCYKALSRGEQPELDAEAIVPVPIQAEAARQVSSDLLPEVRSFGPQGNNLHTFVLRLGSLFSLSQQSPAQSEPERTHFSITGGDSQIRDAARELLSEAVKWSVLFEEKGTKKKDSADAEGVEYVLNPIYAPYFHVSYRKRRRLDLLPTEVETILCGDYPAVRTLLKDFQRRWAVEPAETQLPLFAHLADEGQQ